MARMARMWKVGGSTAKWWARLAGDARMTRTAMSGCIDDSKLPRTCRRMTVLCWSSNFSYSVWEMTCTCDRPRPHNSSLTSCAAVFEQFKLSEKKTVQTQKT